MSQYPLKLKPMSQHGMSTRIGVQLKEKPREDARDASKRRTGVHAGGGCPECPECPDPEPCVEQKLPAGADDWEDAPEIPLAEFYDRKSRATYNKCFGVQEGEPEHGYGELWRTAWWKLFVPDGQTWYLSLDTRLSFWERGGIPDTVFAVYAMYEPWDIGAIGPSTVADSDTGVDAFAGTVSYNFARGTVITLHGNASGDEERDPPDGKGPGTWFYIQVAGFHNEADDLGGVPAAVAYVINVSLSQFELGSIPQDEQDPDSVPDGECFPAFADQMTDTIAAPHYRGDDEGSMEFIGDRLFARGLAPDNGQIGRMFDVEPPSADYSISANVNFAATRAGGTTNDLQLGLRWSEAGTNVNGYVFKISSVPMDLGQLSCSVAIIVNSVEVYEFLSPTLFPCGNSNLADVKASIVGGRLKLFIDGTEVWTDIDTDITIPNAGKPYLGMYPENITSALYFSVTLTANEE